jgi:hypothetical protein
LDLIIKLIGTIGSVFALYKILITIINLKKDNFKKDFEIAEKFLNEELDKKHDFLVEIGYSAMTGKKLDASLIRYILSKRDPLSKLSFYHSGMKYIKINKNLEKEIISLSLIDELNTEKKLKIKRLKLLIPYVLYAFLGFLTLIFINEIIKHNISIIFIFSIPFLFLAGIQIYEASVLIKAKKLCDELEYLNN